MKLQFVTLVLLALGIVQISASCSNTGKSTMPKGNTDADSDSDADMDTDTDTDTDSDTDADTDSGTETGTGSVTVPPLPDNSSIIYLIHSTGGRIWDAGVATWFSNYNTANGKSYAIDARTYPAGMDNHPYDYWNIWVNHAGTSQYEYNDTLELLAADYNVIVFKHCFTAAVIEAADGSPDVTSSTMTLENFKLQYEALKTKMLSFPDKRFLLWTNPALLDGQTTADQANRVKDFVDWVKNDWDDPGDNIYLWDFYELETEGGLYMNPAYAEGEYNAHPNTAFSATVAPYMSQRIIDVIQGKGDISSITGQ